MLLTKDLIIYSIFGILFFSPVFWYTSQDWQQESIFSGSTTDIKVDQDYKPLGKIAYNTTSTAVFKITNTGENPLVIQKVSSFCKHLIPHWSNQPIQPGQSTEIEVAFTPSMPGNFIKTIEISCNTSQQTYFCRIFGTVEINSSDLHVTANN